MEDREQTEKQNFLTLGDLVRISNNVFIESQGLFSLPTEGWLRDRLCNVIEIKNNGMIQSFLVERSWNQ